MLKVELHSHCNLDPKDNLNYSAKELIDKAKRLNFDILAITCHHEVAHTKELEDYAKKRNILLVPGVELSIKGKDILVYNITNEEIKHIKTIEELRNFKENKIKKNQPILIIAPHPFHGDTCCLKEKIIEEINLFDAWEISFFYHKMWNPNKKTLKLAKKYNKPLIGNSDVHRLQDLEKTYSLIDCDKNIESLFSAIKNNNVKIKSNPISSKSFFYIFYKVIKSKIRKKIVKLFNS